MRKQSTEIKDIIECQLQNMNRQDWIKMVCIEKLRTIQSSRIANTV